MYITKHDEQHNKPIQKKEITIMTKEIKAGKVTSNRVAKFQRVIANLFCAFMFKEKQLATAREMSMNGIFTRMQKDLNDLKALKKLQDDTIVEYETAVASKQKEMDATIENKRKPLEAEIKALTDAQTAVANASEKEVKLIKKEVERTSKLMDRIEDFLDV